MATRRSDPKTTETLGLREGNTAGQIHVAPGMTLTRYRWTLDLHDGAERDEGVVLASSLDEATQFAITDAFGGESEVDPDRREPGFVSWACMAGATTLHVVIEDRPRD